MKLTDLQISLIGAQIDLPGGSRVVLIDVGGRKDVSAEDHNCNVYRVNANGDISWKVMAPRPLMERDSFVDMELDKGLLRANRFFGSEYEIDLETGYAQEIGWHK
ncbi:MAG TPA: hypothetical protein VGE19_06115 [Pseudoxanthomonas sp.]